MKWNHVENYISIESTPKKIWYEDLISILGSSFDKQHE